LTTDLTRAIERVNGRSPWPDTSGDPDISGAADLRERRTQQPESFLDSSMTVIRSGGRLVVITFHSLKIGS